MKKIIGIGAIFFAAPLIVVILCFISIKTVPLWLNVIWVLLSLVTAVFARWKELDLHLNTKRARMEILRLQHKQPNSVLKQYVLNEYDLSDKKNAVYCEFICDSLDKLSFSDLKTVQNGKSATKNIFTKIFEFLTLDRVFLVGFPFLYWGGLSCGVTTIPVSVWGAVPFIIGVACFIASLILAHRMEK